MAEEVEKVRCRYCAWLEHEEPKTQNKSWEPLNWKCGKGLIYLESDRVCQGYQRVPGVDDDLGDVMELISKGPDRATKARSDRRRSRWAS